MQSEDQAITQKFGEESSTPPSPIEEEHKRGVYFQEATTRDPGQALICPRKISWERPAQGKRKV